MKITFRLLARQNNTRFDNYYYGDTTGRRVTLPGKPGMAVRVRRIGADGQPVKTELPGD